MGDGRDEDVVSVEELKVDGVGGGILWIMEPHGAEEGCAVDALAMEVGVDIVQELVSGIFECKVSIAIPVPGEEVYFTSG